MVFVVMYMEGREEGVEGVESLALSLNSCIFFFCIWFLFLGFFSLCSN